MDDLGLQLNKVVRGKVKFSELLAGHTSFRIGGPADFWVEPVDSDDLCNLVRFLNGAKVPRVTLGNGSNVIFMDEGFRGVVISLENFNSVEVKDDCIIVGAGTALSVVLNTAVNSELEGLEFMAGIPGTVGGAVITNAGGRDGEIGAIIRELTVLDSSANVGYITGEQAGFGYRKCSLLSGTVVVKVNMGLRKGRKKDIMGRVSEILEYRKSTQPLDLPSAGCIFKNPDGKSAGKLIAAAGLAGRRIGDAEVSTRHANFIVNRGEARASDVICLIDTIESEISRCFGIKFEREVKIIEN